MMTLLMTRLNLGEVPLERIRINGCDEERVFAPVAAVKELGVEYLKTTSSERDEFTFGERRRSGRGNRVDHRKLQRFPKPIA